MIEGLDLSSYNAVDLNAMKKYKSLGAEFIFVKLTESLGYKNPNAGQAIANGFKAGFETVGAYHFFHGSGKAEAQQFLFMVNKYGLDKTTPLMIDAETPDIGGTASINEFLDECYKNGYKNLFVYSMASYFGVRINASKIRHAKLWVANYGGYIGVDNASIWQHTDNWKGLHVDGNYAYFPKDLGLETTKDKPYPYWTDGSRFEVLTDSVNCYKDEDFEIPNEKVGSRDKGYVIKATPVKVGNIYRLKTAYGNYYTANRKYVKKLS